MAKQGDNIVFTPDELIGACDAALAAAGIQTMPTGDSPIAARLQAAAALNTVFFEQGAIRPGKNGVSYQTICARVGAKVGPITYRFKGELHCGQIEPISDKELQRLNAKLNPKASPLKKRQGHPRLQFQRWRGQVETEEDGITVKLDAETGLPMVPPADSASQVFAIQAYISLWFIGLMIQRRKSEMILSRDEEYKIADGIAPKGALVVENCKICDPIQWKISNKPGVRNAGKVLPNPFCRVLMKFNDAGLPMNVAFHDKSRTTRNAQGKPDFEKLMFADPESGVRGYVTANNVHLIAPRSVHDGLVRQDSIAYSNMGISIPANLLIDVYSAPKQFAVSLADMGYDESEFGEVDASASAAANGDAPASVANGGAPASAGAAAPAPAAAAASGSYQAGSDEVSADVAAAFADLDFADGE